MNEILARRGLLNGLGVARIGKQIYPTVNKIKKTMTLAHENSNQEIKQINSEIENTEKYLNSLYRKRAGRVLWNNGDDIEFAWCVSCGIGNVNPNVGEDTCFDCKKKI